MSSFPLLAFVLLFGVLSTLAGATPLSDSAAAPWKQDFTLTERMKVYDFPEEQVSYALEVPKGIQPESLKLLAFAGNDARVLPFQLIKDAKGGSTLFFRTDLPQGATRLFRLTSGFAVTDIPVVSVEAPALQTTSNPHEAVLANSLLQVKVPAGHEAFAGGKAFAQVAAPILAMARKAKPEAWMATGSFSAPDSLRVDSIDAKLLESGPLFATYQISYQLQGKKSYTVTLELRAQRVLCPHCRIGGRLHARGSGIPETELWQGAS